MTVHLLSEEVDTTVVEDFRSRLAKSLSPSSQKAYLRIISACWDWGMQQGLVSNNPWRAAVSLINVPPKQRPQPFTSQEIDAIIQGFSKSRYYCYYTDFVRFLFGSGCRIGEAIGLCWGHLSDNCTKVWIGESVSRGKRKSTKTNRSREFRLSQSLTELLLNRRPVDYRADDLVFPAVKGGVIDDHNFRNRAWRLVLQDAKVIYRKPYNTRHTFISHALDKGISPMAIAQMTGHDPEILFKHYAADIQGGLQLPEIFS
ncbi:site-specific integrase [Romeriopsis navalis]|nr:site-specific integrase [Romeriopsis navalis]